MSRHKGGYTMTRSERSASGELIETARMEKNISIAQLARQAKLSDGTVSLIEREGVICTKVCTLIAICRVLDLEPMELIKADLGGYYE